MRKQKGKGKRHGVNHFSGDLSPLNQAHLKVIFGKLGVTGRTEAIAIALRKHLLKI